jgi:VanZ family protein
MPSVASDELHARAASLRTKRARRVLIGFFLLLLCLTHFPNPYPSRGEPEHWDKLAHFGLYAVLAGLALRVLSLRKAGWHPFIRCAAVLACVTAFGLLDEFTQPFTGRDFDWFDWLADAVGALSGTLAYELLRRRRVG